MPAMYWPRAMPSRPSGVFWTAPRRFSLMSLMASRWNMEIKNLEEKAIKFYANKFFFYSVYNGATDKTKAKCQFEYMLDKIVEEMKQ